MQQVSENPKMLQHMFVCKEKEFKRFYGDFALNKRKSEIIIGQHNQYFNVSFDYYINTLALFIISLDDIRLMLNNNAKFGLILGNPTSKSFERKTQCAINDTHTKDYSISIVAKRYLS